MTRELTLGSPHSQNLPMSAAASQMTRVAGTHVGAVAGGPAVPRVESRSPRQRFTTKYSATMIPAMGGKATPSRMRKSTNRSRIPAAASTLPSIPTTRVGSEEHTSELQSRQYLVCRLLLEQKNSRSAV